MTQMVAEQLAAHGAQRLLRRRHLNEDVGAISFALNHSLQTPHLAFDAAQPVEIARLDLRINGHSETAALALDTASAPYVRDAQSTLSSCDRQNILPALPTVRRRYNLALHAAQLIRAVRNRKLFNTTLTELNAIAALASTGLSNTPNAGYSAPAATGIPMTL
jgi:hypothetical protein